MCEPVIAMVGQQLRLNVTRQSLKPGTDNICHGEAKSNEGRSEYDPIHGHSTSVVQYEGSNRYRQMHKILPGG